MELVVAMLKCKLASIDVIGMEEFPFESVLGKDVGAGLKKVFHHLCLLLSFRNDTHSRLVLRISGRQIPYVKQG
jgi:hypothetical protein